MKIKVILAISCVLIPFLLYILSFRMIGQDYRIDILSLKKITRTPISSNSTLWFSKGWQVRNEWMGETNSKHDTNVKVSIKNNDNHPLFISMQLHPGGVSALSDQFIGFREYLEPNKQEIIYNGKLSNFIGKIIRIENESYLKTSFELIIEAEKEIELKSPLIIFAYIPAQTI